MVSDTDKVEITCSNTLESSGNTSWTVQNAEVAIFKSLMFSNCNRRLAVENVSNVYFQNIIFR